MNLPSYQPRKLPEGRYTFKVSKEPEKRRHQGAQGEFISVTFYFKAQDSNGDVRNHTESLLPWEDRYRDILIALGGLEDESGNVHLGEMEDILGRKFKAWIKHMPDKDDPQKTWARIWDIETGEKEADAGDEDVPPPADNGYDEPSDEEIPF